MDGQLTMYIVCFVSLVVRALAVLCFRFMSVGGCCVRLPK